MRTILLFYLIVYNVIYWKVKAAGTNCDPADSDTECGKVILKNERNMWKNALGWIACWLEQINYELDESEAKCLMKSQKNLRKVSQRIELQLGEVKQRDPTDYGHKYRKNKRKYIDKYGKILYGADLIVQYAGKCIQKLTGKKDKRCDRPDDVRFYVKQLDKDEAEKLRNKHEKKLDGGKGKKQKKESSKTLLKKIAKKLRTRKPKKQKSAKHKRVIVAKTEKLSYDRDSLVKKLVECAEHKAKEHKAERTKCIKKCQRRRKLCHEGCKKVAKETVKQYVNCLNKSVKTKPHEETKEKNKKQNHKTKSKNKKRQKKKSPRKKKKKSMKKKKKPKKKNRKKKLR